MMCVLVCVYVFYTVRIHTYAHTYKYIYYVCMHLFLFKYFAFILTLDIDDGVDNAYDRKGGSYRYAYERNGMRLAELMHHLLYYRHSMYGKKCLPKKKLI